MVLHMRLCTAVCTDAAASPCLPAQGGHIQPPYWECSPSRVNLHLSQTTVPIKALLGCTLAMQLWGQSQATVTTSALGLFLLLAMYA